MVRREIGRWRKLPINKTNFVPMKIKKDNKIADFSWKTEPNVSCMSIFTV